MGLNQSHPTPAPVEDSGDTFASITVEDLTAYRPVFTDGAKKLTTGGQAIFAAATDAIIYSSVTGNSQDRYTLLADGTQKWGSGSAAADVTLARADAGVLEQRSVGQYQTYNVYNQYMDVDNYARFSIQATAGLGTVLSQQSAGGGNSYPLYIYTEGAQDLYLGTGGSARWYIDGAGATGALLPNGSRDVGKGFGGVRYYYSQAGSAANPSFRFEDEATGIYKPAASQIGFSIGGTAKAKLDTDGGWYLLNNNAILALGAGSDTVLRRAAADVFSISRGSNSQTLYIYNSTDSDSAPGVYQRLELLAAAGLTSLVQSQGGGAAALSLEIGTYGNNSLILTTNAQSRWTVTGTGDLKSNGNNVYDIGDATNPPKTIYVGTSIINAGQYLGNPAGVVSFGSASLATTDTVGWLTIPSCAGAPTGVPANVPTGQVGFTYDRTNNKVYVYNGGWKRAQVTAVDAIYA